MSRRKNGRRPKLIDTSGIPITVQYEVFDFIIKCVVEGIPKSEIEVEVKKEFNKIKTQENFNKLYSKSLNFFKDNAVDFLQLDEIIVSHISIYEKVYKFFSDLGYIQGKRQAMLGKEKLLGFHSFNVVDYIEEVEVQEEYNLSLLSIEERKWLFEKIALTGLPDLTKELELQLRRDVLTDSYFEFFKWSFTILFPNEKYEDTFHIKYLCDLYQSEVERIIRREEKTKDIIVNIPPRTSKSLITSVCLLAWMWIKDPTLPMISISFDEDLVLLNAQYCKDIINSVEYQELFGHIFQIRRDTDSKSFFMNSKGGFRLSKTTGSNITGHKGVVIVIDDPQNPKTAESILKRKETIDYYTKSLYNRLTPIDIGLRILIMQRLHQGDLTGNLLETAPEDYYHICLPAILQEVDQKDSQGNLIKSMVRVLPEKLKEGYIDRLLDPKRLSLKTLTSFKKVLGTRGYSGQYQQTPSDEEGGILKAAWFDIVRPEFITRDPQQSPIHFFLDTAYTDNNEDNDPTAILVGFEKEGYLYILDVIEVYLTFPDLVKFIPEYCGRFQYSTQLSKIYIEPKASGKSIAQQLRSTTKLNIIELPPPVDDKVTRANSISPICEGRRVKLVEGSYIQNFLDQVRLFPNAVHDDMVDDLVNFVNTLLVNDNPDVLWM